MSKIFRKIFCLAPRAAPAAPTAPAAPAAPSKGRRIREGFTLSLDFISAVSEATDLLKPLKAACEAVKVVLKAAKDIDDVNGDWKDLMKRLGFHLATVENYLVKLEEDKEIDGATPALDEAIKDPLEDYARHLEEIYKLLLDNQPDHSPLVHKITDLNHNKGIITGKTRDMDDAFQRYTTALHMFAAITISQMQQELSQFHREFRQEAENAHLNRLKASNTYGIQHRECLQGTREKTLPAISNWIDDQLTPKWIFFFLDVAGSGKSTVAKHMAEKWKRENRLLARFFFSRDTTETMSTNSFCSTVASSFADLDPNFKAHVDKFMQRRTVGLLPFQELFEGLVAGPLRAIGRPAILIIDALDECDPGQRDQMLETLRDQHNSIPLLRIFATGRPERDIRRWAEEKLSLGYTNFTQLEGSDKDVELYINHRLQGLPIAQDRLYPVIRHAEGLFIWARIACDLLVNSDDIDGLLGELGKEVSLDYLYTVALKQSMSKDEASRRAMVLVLQMILAAREPLSIAELEMLSPKRGIVENVVTRLGSVLLYQGREGPIRLLHATFNEFLTARSKADMFFIEPKLGHHTLAAGSLNAISYVLKQDKATLDEPSVTLNRTFIYASRSWAYHCSMSYRKLALNKQILEFANNGLNAWIGLANSWRNLRAEDNVHSVLLLLRQNVSPEATRVLVSQGLEAIKAKELESEFEFKSLGSLEFLGSGFGDLKATKESWTKLRKKFEEFQATLPSYT